MKEADHADVKMEGKRSQGRYYFFYKKVSRNVENNNLATKYIAFGFRYVEKEYTSV